MDRIILFSKLLFGGRRFFLCWAVFCSLSFLSRASDFVLIVDASISMKSEANVPGKIGQRRLDIVIEALQSSLQEIPLGSRVYLAAFNRVITPQAELVLQTEADRARLIQAVSTLDSLVARESESGGTHLWSALDHALQKGTEYVKNDTEHTLVVRVYTDGEDNDNNPRYRGKSKQQIIQELRDKYPAVADYVTLVLLGNMDFYLRGINSTSGGINVTKAADFRFVLPTIIVDPPAPDAGNLVRFTVPANQVFDTFDWSVDGQPKSRDRIFSCSFPNPGTYQVRLTVTAHNGQREAVSKSVQVGANLNPSFTFVPAGPEPGETVAFFGRASQAALSPSWLVDGADAGAGSELQKVFAQEGQHEIVFRVKDSAGRMATLTNRVTVAEKPLAVAFDTPPEVVSGKEVEFKNTTLGRASVWRWDFGDQQSSPDQHPHHHFVNSSEQPVQFHVVLHATSPLGREFASEPHTIIVHPSPKPPKAAFHVGQSRAKVGQLVNFSDDSTGIITSRGWQFADEGESSLATPEHAFRTPGEKTVRLTVTGPGGSDTVTQKVPVRPQQTSVTVSVVDPNSSAPLDLPRSIDFGRINPVNLHTGDFIGDGKDTIQFVFSDEPEDSSAVVLSVASTNDAFCLQLRHDGKTVPLTLPARLRGNSLVLIALNTNAPEGIHEASVILTPVGADLVLNETNQPLTLGLRVKIGSDSGPEFVILLLVVLTVIGWIVYKLWPKGPTRDSQVTIGLAEHHEPTKGTTTVHSAARANQRFIVANGDMIVLGQSQDSKHIFDLKAPDWRIRREASRIVLVDRRDSKTASILKSGDLKEIKTQEGIVRRIAIAIQIGPPIKPKKIVTQKTIGRR